MKINYPEELQPTLCTECDTEMLQGYYNEDEGHTFCSSECMDRYYKEPISKQLVEQTDEDLDLFTIFWTEWDDYTEERERYKRLFLTLQQLETAPEDDLTGLYMAIDRDMLEHCNDEPEPKIRIVWTVGYNQYFSQSIASIFETSQDKATVGYLIIRPYQTVREGACKSRVYRNLQEARNVINHMKKEIR